MADSDPTEPSGDAQELRVESSLVLRGILPNDPVRRILKGKRFLLGRDPSCDVQIDQSKISRQHARLERQGPIYALGDLGSRNGSFLDGKRVVHSVVKPGMILRLGDWLAIFEEVPETEPSTTFGELAPGIFGGPLLRRTLNPLRAAASTDLPVVLLGSTGAGKERFAAALHALSGRKGPFHAVNCGAVPVAMAEAELFGYRRGAFTGAERPHDGHLRAADRGTLFLDEFGDLPIEVQTKLLRALERRTVTPLGGTQELEFDARIVVATQRPLNELVGSGRLRADLVARVSGLTVPIPPLAQRRGDVPALFEKFLSDLSGGHPPAVSPRLHERLCIHDWPGNVRELELLARQLLAVCALERELVCSHLPEHLKERGVADSHEDGSPPSRESRGEYDLRRLTSSLQQTRGNVRLAAQLSGISRQRAYRLLATIDRAASRAAMGGDNDDSSR